MEPIEDSLKKLTREELLSGDSKDARIEIRTTSTEKRDIQLVAEGLDLSVAEYFLRLHRVARRTLKL